MASRATGPIKKSKNSVESLPLEERIRQRAHAIYVARGGHEGSELQDWLQAEQELRAEQSPGKSSTE